MAEDNVIDLDERRPDFDCDYYADAESVAEAFASWVPVLKLAILNKSSKVACRATVDILIDHLHDISEAIDRFPEDEAQ